MMTTPEVTVKATVPPPLFGYNSSVRRGGRTFHVQTEDSGRGHPHVITHVFAEGGRIVATHRTSYAEQLGDPECAVFVRRLLITQHREAFIALHEGRYDDGDDRRLDDGGGFDLAELGATGVDVSPAAVAANIGTIAEPADLEPSLALLVGFDASELSLDDIILRDAEPRP